MTENLKKLRAEKDDAEKKLAQAEHELNRIEQLIRHTSKRAPNQRTHHLCNMGGAILALCPEMDALDKMEFYDLMRQVFRLPEVQKLIEQTTKA